MRKHPTEPERLLWRHLKDHLLGGFKFRRQQQLGQYIVDFLCWEQRLVVEVDGGQHGKESNADRERTTWLEAQGFRVLRFWNNEVIENLDGVIQVILAVLEEGKDIQPSPLDGVRWAWIAKRQKYSTSVRRGHHGRVRHHPF
ncbi:MAG: endonuclease domain-containing protein [Chloroflexi bacterium]|nr:endonuclease domain-containing protein [Chloroflexota bacterium]